jgi:lysyl-tRNA synthetase class 2
MNTALMCMQVSSVALAVCGATLVPYQETTIELAPPWRRASMAELVHEQVGPALRYKSL